MIGATVIGADLGLARPLQLQRDSHRDHAHPTADRTAARVVRDLRGRGAAADQYPLPEDLLDLARKGLGPVDAVDEVRDTGHVDAIECLERLRILAPACEGEEQVGPMRGGELAGLQTRQNELRELVVIDHDPGPRFASGPDQPIELVSHDYLHTHARKPSYALPASG